MVSEYALIYMNMSNFARILNIPESTKIYPNVGKHTLIYLTLYNCIFPKYYVLKYVGGPKNVKSAYILYVAFKVCLDISEAEGFLIYQGC